MEHKSLFLWGLSKTYNYFFSLCFSSQKSIAPLLLQYLQIIWFEKMFRKIIKRFLSLGTYYLNCNRP
jgi:hypothetical protein